MNYSLSLRMPSQARLGSNHGAAKLTEDAVRAIRRRHANGETQTALAIEFGISRFACNHLVHFRTWQHVPDEGPQVGAF